MVYTPSETTPSNLKPKLSNKQIDLITNCAKTMPKY